MYRKSKIAYTYWRSGTLYLRLPAKSDYNPTDMPIREPLLIRHSDSKKEFDRCYELAENTLAKLRTSVIEGNFFKLQPKPVNPEFPELVENYTDKRIKHSKSPHSGKNVMKKALLEFATRLARSISTEEIRSWLQGFLDRGYAISSVNAFRNFTSAVFNTWNKTFTDDMHQIKNPVTPIKKFGSGNVRGYYLEPKKFRAYLRTARTIDPCFADFWQGGWELGGRRPTEIALYDWDKVDLETGEITVSDINTKTGDNDVVSLSPWMRRYLESIPEDERHGPIFKTALGKRWKPRKWVAKMKRIRKEIGDPKVWFRDYRRGFISTRLRQGAQAKDVMLATGQKDLKTLMRYYSPAADAKSKMVAAASEDLKPQDQGKLDGKMDATSQNPSDPTPNDNGFLPSEEKPQKRSDEENGAVLTPAA
jgi:integrase